MGMDYKINLSDGSEIWLNSMSKLIFPSEFASDKRVVTIDGEAYLNVAKNPSKPFIVRLPENTIEVTGTEFNINTYNKNSVRVALVDGGINLTSSTSTVKMKPGTQAVVTNGLVNLESFDDQKGS